MKNLLDYTLDELKEFLSETMEKSFRAEQVFNWIYKKGIYDPSEMLNLPETLRENLLNSHSPFPLEIAEKAQSRDNCIKLLFQCEDKAMIESVSMPSDDGRTTFCLSTQVGCPIGCVFCATGAIGYKRNLNAGEIVAEVLLLEKESTRPSNIVLMGMGESLLNSSEVSRFIRIISEPKGYGLSERRITLSTAGLLNELWRFHREHPKVELAISLNASDNETRKKIMPNKKLASFSEIIDAVRRFNSDITLEYILIGGINDSKDDATRLLKALRGLPYVRVNLIGYNTTSKGFKTPKIEHVLEFQKILREGGVKCFVRKSLGSDIKAACGQMSGTRKPPEKT